MITHLKLQTITIDDLLANLFFKFKLTILYYHAWWLYLIHYLQLYHNYKYPTFFLNRKTFITKLGVTNLNTFDLFVKYYSTLIIQLISCTDLRKLAIKGSASTPGTILNVLFPEIFFILYAHWLLQILNLLAFNSDFVVAYKIYSFIRWRNNK